MTNLQLHPGGRPSAYRSEFTELAHNYCVLGATDMQLAAFFDVSEVTLNAWKKRHPEFLNMLNRGKMIADAQVAHALYKRAIGYDFIQTQLVVNQGQIIRAEVTKHLPPDVRACIFWLINRQPNLWHR